MTIEDALITMATYSGDVQYQAELFTAKKVLEDSGITCERVTYGDFNIQDKKISYTLIKSNSGDWYCSKDCEFVYKRSVEGRMLPVGIRDKKIGTVVLMYMDLEEKKDSTYIPALFYPEFYIYQGEKERKYINYSTHYFYYPPNYVKPSITTVEFLQEIKVNGEGKNVFVIGCTSPTSYEEDKVYLYKIKVFE